MTGQFFAVGTDAWSAACALGLNPAVAFLVLARGSGRDNVTTRWSADAVARCTGMSWQRAKVALGELERAQLACVTTQQSQRPTRKLAFPDDLENVLWLPNTLVDGVASKSSPIARLRQTQNVNYLQAFVELYGLQDLAGDGGLPRSLVWQCYTRKPLCDAGQYKVYGFNTDRHASCNTRGPLARFNDKAKPKDGWTVWKFLDLLKNLGLLETVHYLAEGETAEAELIHALTGDADAQAVLDAAFDAVAALPEWVSHTADQHAYVLPVIRDIPAPAIVGVYRLTFRPHTKLTAAWYAQHQAACQRFIDVYGALARGDFQRAIAA